MGSRPLVLQMLGPELQCGFNLATSLSGLNELVPENLLAIFDENELEVSAHLNLLFVWFFFTRVEGTWVPGQVYGGQKATVDLVLSFLPPHESPDRRKCFCLLSHLTRPKTAVLESMPYGPLLAVPSVSGVARKSFGGEG